MFGKIKQWLLQNKTTDQTIAKNTVWLFTGQIVSRLLRAAIVIYAARVLGAAGWGTFSYAISIATFLTIFSDFGINALVTREASKKPELKNHYLATAFFIKLALVAALIAFILVFGSQLTKIEAVKPLMLIAIFIFAFDTMRDLGAAVTRALEKMQIEAVLVIATNFLIVALGFVFLMVLPTPKSLAAAYSLGSGLGFLINAAVLKNYFSNLIGNFRKELVQPIISAAWPFGLLALLGALMLNTDIIMLGWLRSVEEVGYYATAQKPIQLLYTLPGLLATAFFPVLSKLAGRPENKDEFKKVLEKALVIVLVAALPITLGGLIIGDQLIPGLFGAAYQSSVTPFLILLLTLPLVFPSTVLGNALFAHDRQKNFIVYVALGAGSNVIANFLLIPPLGIVGCAIATVISNFLSNSLFWIKMKRLTPFSIGAQFKKSLAALLLMAAAALIFKNLGAPFYLTIIFSALIYFWLLKKSLRLSRSATN